jgi:hypothetical protein
MSAAGSGAIDAEEEASKKRRRDESFAVSGEVEADDIVIISHMGADGAEQEMETDAMTTCFIDHWMSVRNFVCVADCAKKPIVIGDHTHQTRNNARYVKKMIPNTNWLKGINCDVMILIGHGTPSNTSPAYISFCESPGVDVDGVPREISPDATKIWSCSSWEDRDGDIYTKPPGGVHLSEVVGGSKLVMMLCCYGEIIAREYEYGDSLNTRKPDLLIFKHSSYIHNTSMYVFLALLMTCVEKFYSNHTASYDASIKRHIYQVLLWIQTHGTSAKAFWTFLMTHGCVYHTSSTGFQIKGTTYVWQLRGHCKQLLLDELKTLSLGLCSLETDAFGGCYTWVDSSHKKEELEARTKAPAPAASSEVVKHDELWHMLLQLKGMISA